MRHSLSWIVLLVASVFASGPLRAQDDIYLEDVQAAERHLQRGEVARARSIFEEILFDHEDLAGSADAPSAEAVLRSRRGLLEIDLRAGQYDEVIQRVEDAPTEVRGDPGVRVLLARSLTRRGKLDRARVVLEELSETGGFRARCMLAELLAETGQRAEAKKVWESIVEDSRSRAVRSAAELTWLARAHIHLGGRSSIEQASGLLVEAIRLDPDAPEPRILDGRLRFEVYGEWEGATSGERSLLEVLERNGEVEEALVLLYRIRSTNHLLDPRKTEAFLDRALAVNPNSVPALLERGIGLIDDRRFEEGVRTLERALEIDPNDKAVLAQRAALASLMGEPDAAAGFRERAMAIDPAYAGVDVAFGDRLVALYRFADAVPFYENALEVDPDRIEALHGLAKAKIYTGEGEDAKRLLERARELQAGFVNPWRNNAIAVQDLLEEEYETIEEGGFVFHLHRSDRDVLVRYLVPYYREAREVLGRKYGYLPADPVRVEVLHTWDDFSVRTIGFRGFTALGACFGPMITLVSPVDSDLRRNDFMWTATVWHEYAHVLTLALSDHRVPRWLTEGCSVYEERARDPSWERGMTRDLFDAWHNGEIVPVRLMNRLFRGPRILFGYYQGGLVVERIAEEQGFDKVVDMLRAYAQDRSTEEIFQEVLGVDTRDFDRQFLEWIRDEKLDGLRLVPRWSDESVQKLLGKVARDPDDVESHLALAWALIQRGVGIDAAHHLREVLTREPDHAEAQLVFAELHRRRGRVDEAVEAYEKGFGGGADDFDSRIEYGKLLAARGDVDGAVSQWLAAKRCWPGCTEQDKAPELLLARLYREQDRRDAAMMELTAYCRRTARAYEPRIDLAGFALEAGDRRRQAELLEQAVAIDPFDRRVHIQLADAYLAMNRAADAATELEVALAIPPALDRGNLGRAPAEVPGADSEEYREEQAGLCLRLGKVLAELGREGAAREYLERAVREAPEGAAAREARALLESPR